MRIAITGPTGSIGMDLIGVHLEAGDEVIAIVNPKSGRAKNIPEGVEVVPCDISNYENISGKNKCDIFYHLAWSGTGPDSRDDVDIQSKNIQYSLDAVKLAKSWGAKKFIGAGSQAEYGHLDHIIDKDTPTNPISAYGVAKYCSGKLCGIACKQMGMEFNWTRVLSVFGKYDRDDALVTYLIDTLLKGNTPRMTNCLQTWDLMSSEDCARALRSVALKGIDGKTYVVGSGEHRILKDYSETIRTTINPSAIIEYGSIDYYSKQTVFLGANISELISDTGFKPNVSFENGLKKVITYRKSLLDSQSG